MVVVVVLYRRKTRVGRRGHHNRLFGFNRPTAMTSLTKKNPSRARHRIVSAGSHFSPAKESWSLQHYYNNNRSCCYLRQPDKHIITGLVSGFGVSECMPRVMITIIFGVRPRLTDCCSLACWQLSFAQKNNQIHIIFIIRRRRRRCVLAIVPTAIASVILLYYKTYNLYIISTKVFNLSVDNLYYEVTTIMIITII